MSESRMIVEYFIRQDASNNNFFLKVFKEDLIVFFFILLNSPFCLIIVLVFKHIPHYFTFFSFFFNHVGL